MPAKLLEDKKQDNPEFGDELEESESLAENQIYDYITNMPIKDTPIERVLQVVARSMVEEYGFDHTQLQRVQSVFYDVYDD